MHSIREEIEIKAPARRIWAAAHEDITSVPLWSRNLSRCEIVGPGPVQTGTSLRFDIKLPVGRTVTMNLRVDEYEPFERCAGTIEHPGMQGTWCWTYRELAMRTQVSYETEFNLSGLLRLTMPLVEHELRTVTRHNLAALKAYVESGQRPTKATNRAS